MVLPIRAEVKAGPGGGGHYGGAGGGGVIIQGQKPRAQNSDGVGYGAGGGVGSGIPGAVFIIVDN